MPRKKKLGLEISALPIKVSFNTPLEELANLKSGEYNPLDADKTYIVFGLSTDIKKVEKAYKLRNIIEKLENL